jgi:3' terminal RNA ribose 2'-O-methyltransferase Hen1
VLLPVLDDAKHYWVSTDEVDKLVTAGGDWLATHPEKELITERYLTHQRQLTREALARLAELDDTEPAELDNSLEPARPLTESPEHAALRDQRRGAVLAAVRASGAKRVADLGCGEGALVGDLLADPSIERIVATDVSVRALQVASRKLRLDRMPDAQRARLELFQSSLTYRDERIAGLDAAVLMEVIEHIDQSRLPALEQVIYGYASPATVIVTTPNAEHNVRYQTLPPGQRRHRDHRFEWSRTEFRAWADGVGGRFGYHVRFVPVGPDDPDVGPPTQMAIFQKAAPI